MKPILDAMEGISDECEQLLPQLCDDTIKKEAYYSLQVYIKLLLVIYYSIINNNSSNIYNLLKNGNEDMIKSDHA